MFELLEELVSRPSPGTMEDPVQERVLAHFKRLCDRTETDLLGDVVGVLNEKAETRLLLVAHVDEIGLMISRIEEKGFLRVRALGGCRPDAMVGQRVAVHTARGAVPGVVGRTIGPAPKTEIKTEDLWLDIGTLSRKDAEKLVCVGDPVTPSCTLERLHGDRVTGRGLDDRAGVAVLLAALRLVRADRRKPKVAVYALSSVQEEGGRFRGALTRAFDIDPHASIVVDVADSQDYPGRTGQFRIGDGPLISKSLTVNRKVNNLLVKSARAKKIPYTFTAEPQATGTDGDVIASSRGGTAVGVVSIPTRYIHSPSEVLSLKDLELTARLIAEFVLRLPSKPDFRPLNPTT